jgi:hypothetical protein
LQVERLEIVGRLEAEDGAEEGQPCLEGAALGRLAAEPVTLPLERQVGVRDAGRGECLDDQLRLDRRDDPILGTFRTPSTATPTASIRRGSPPGACARPFRS